MRKSLILILATMAAFILQAQPRGGNRSEGQVQQFAAQLKHNPQTTLQQASTPEFAHIHLYNIDGGGWIVAGGDSRSRTILAYSDNGAIDLNAMPDNMRYMLGEYERQLSLADDGALETSEPQGTQTFKGASKDYPDMVAPLLVAQWGQNGHGYDSQSPYDSLMGRHVTPGCGPVALAQVMHYWQWPQHGYGRQSYSESYACWHYGTLSVNFDSAYYDYSMMPARLTDSSSAAEVEAVATLLYHCGVACDVSYNIDCARSTSAESNNLLRGLKRFFHYSPAARDVYAGSYSSTDWAALIKGELAAGRPVIYSGTSAASGHWFVLDGYDTNGMFHINWGWGGSSNGYYQLYAIPNYNMDQSCLIGVEPERSPLLIPMLASDVTLDSARYGLGEPVSGSYSFTNAGDGTGDLYVRAHCYDNQYTMDITLETAHFVMQPGDTVQHTFASSADVPEGSYHFWLQVGYEPIPDSFIYPVQSYYETVHRSTLDFEVENLSSRKMHNLVLYYRHSDVRDCLHTTYRVTNPMNTEVLPALNKVLRNRMAIQTHFADQFNGSGWAAPCIDAYGSSHYAPYDSLNNPGGDREPYPVCGPSERERELVARMATYFDTMGLVDESLDLDGDGDGEIDHVIFINIGYSYNEQYRNRVTTDHTCRYPVDAEPLTINGKRVGSYSILNGIGSGSEFSSSGFYSSVPSRPLAKSICQAMGLPDLEHSQYHREVHPTADSGLLASGLNGIPAIYKLRYLAIGDEPREITAEGSYTINSSDLSDENRLYYIKSAIDSSQWYLIEYRIFGEGDPANGLYISRWMNGAPTDFCHGGNAPADFYNTPNTYWTFRPGSSIDTSNGNPAQASFSAVSGHTEFGATTDPHPYLADGTPERSFAIYDIAEAGERCTFKVRFISESTAAADADRLECSIFPNPTTTSATVSVSGTAGATEVTVADMTGRTVYQKRSEHGEARFSIPCAHMPRGAYFVRVTNGDASTVKKLIVR